MVLYLGRRETDSQPAQRLQRHRPLTLSDLRRSKDASSRKQSAEGAAVLPGPRVASIRTHSLRLANAVSSKVPPQYLSSIESQLGMAGRSRSRAANYICLRIALALLLPWLVTVIFRKSVSWNLLLAVGALGWFGPRFFLLRLIEARQRLISRGLPDALDLLTVSVEAGLGFDAAVARVSEKIMGPLGDELSYFLREVRMGRSREEALRNLGERSGVADMKVFTSGVIQASRLGVSMGRILRVQSEEMRRRRRQRAEEAAMKAPIKMLFPLVFCIFPALFVVLLGPAFIQIMEAFSHM